MPVPLDVQDTGALVDAIHAAGDLDMVIANAGVVRQTSPATDDFAKAVKDYDAVVGVNLRGVYLAQYAAELVSSAVGAPLSVYTGTLVADTAIPVWHEARHELPFLFGASAAASAGAAAAIAVPVAEAAPARRLALGGALVENVIMLAMEKRLGFVGEPYREGEAGKYAKAAKACTLGGAALLATLGRKSRLAAAAGGGLVLAGEAALRWSVFKVGFQSARDPKFTVKPQRDRHR